MSTISNVPSIGENTPKIRANFSTYLAGAGIALNYRSRRREGEAPIPALVKTGAEMAFYNIVPWAFGAQLAYGGVKALATGLPLAGNALTAQVRSSGAMRFGGTYQDTQAGATMRQRGVNAMQRSVMGSRSILGQEARMMFRG
jgi:hypothetical protein